MAQQQNDTMEESELLAQNSAIFAAVSPGMDIDTATETLVSTLKAFDDELSVEDSLDGVISKINILGNSFALSNADIAEALKRSSAAMAAANTSYEETMALIVGSNEIVQNAESVGNALKTISMRIRGYDEETEEYSEDLSNITGEIADLTKVGSNDFHGVSLFTDETRQTYRSIYDILHDISEIWDELTDKNRATLLETLFGKMRANVGAALISNFDAAEAAMGKMEESAGSAEREMENIFNSLEYKINALKETWTGIGQNLFQRGDIAGVVQALQAVSNIIDVLTDKLGLFGTIGLAMVIKNFVSLTSVTRELGPAVANLTNLMSASQFDGSAAAAMRYAAAVEGLSAVQQRAVLAAAGLSAEQAKQITDMGTLIAQNSTLTVAELAKLMATQQVSEAQQLSNLQSELGAQATQVLTTEMLKNAVVSGTLSGARAQEIAQALKQQAANNGLAGSYMTLSQAMSAFGTMLMNPATLIPTVISGLMVLIPLLKNAWDDINVTSDEAMSAAEEAKRSYEDLQNQITDMQGEIQTNNDRIAELQGMGPLSLIEQEELSKLKTANAELELMIENKRKVAEYDALEADRDYEEAFDKATLWVSDTVDEMVYEYLQGLEEVPEELQGILSQIASGRSDLVTGGMFFNGARETDYTSAVQETVLVMQQLNAQREAGNALSEDEQALYETLEKQMAEYAVYLGALIEDHTNVDRISTETGVAYEETWQQLLDQVNYTINRGEFLAGKLDALPDEVLGAIDAVGEANYSEAADAYDAAVEEASEIGDLSTEAVEQAEEHLEAFHGAAMVTADDITDIAGRYPELNDLMEEYGLTAEEVADHFNSANRAAQEFEETAANIELHPLSDVNEKVGSLADIIMQASQEMFSMGQISGDTLSALSGEVENYQDYLVNVDGQLQLNIDSMRELQRLQISENTSKLQDQIDALEARNVELQETIELNQEFLNQDMTRPWSTEAIENCTEEIEANNEAIRQNQMLLEAYQSILGPLYDTLQMFDRGSDALQGLADIQEAVSEGYTIDVTKVRELAEMYPEILRNAKVSADGQIALNKQVVDAVLVGKRQEINAAIDGEIQKLESQKAILQARIQVIDAEIAAQQSGNEKSVESTRNMAEAQSALYGAVQQACEMYGIDETASNQMACAAMTGDWGEFTTIAQNAVSDLDNESAKRFTSIMNNFAKTAKNIISNSNEIVGAFSQIGKAMSNAMEGEETSSYAGKTAGGSVSGLGGGNKVNNYKNQFSQNTSKYTGSGKTNTQGTIQDIVDEIMKKTADENKSVEELTAEREKLKATLYSIDGQITLLEGLKKANLSVFSNGGKGSGSDSKKNAEKEVEPYIVEIDKFREALERLDRIEIKEKRLDIRMDGTADLATQIGYQQESIDLLEQEQQALVDLVAERRDYMKQQVSMLQGIGFNIDFDPQSNQFFVHNLEHLNQLQAKSAAGYDTLQEATNAYRKEMEELIEELTGLNEENEEASEKWGELENRQIEARIDQFEKRIQIQENEISNAENLMNDAIRRSGSDRTVSGYDSEHVQQIEDEANRIIEAHKRIQDEAHQLAEFYRSKGYADTSDEISALADSWWEAQDAIRDVKQSVVDNLNDIVEATDDAVSKIQDAYDTLHDAADEFAENGGFISVETYQSIIGLGPEYMQYLMDEQGMLTITEDKIRDVIAAKTEQLALDQAMTYVDRLRLALEKDSVEDLNELLYATTKTTGATWDLVYANLAMLDLSSEGYMAALHNIDAMRSLADAAISGIGRQAGEYSSYLEDSEQALSDLIKYVEDMIRDEIQAEIDALEERKKEYSEIIDLRKKDIDAAKEEADYTKEQNKRLKEMAKLQSRLDALANDDSRAASAERAELMEEMAELSEEINEKQQDKTIDAQKEALDAQEQAYSDEKDREIELLEDKISSEQKLYELAIERICDAYRTNWEGLLADLFDWNRQIGDSLNSEILDAFNTASELADKYGDILAAIEAVRSEQEKLGQESSLGGSSSSSGGNQEVPHYQVGQTGQYEHGSGLTLQQKARGIKDIIAMMKANSSKWFGSTDEQRAELDRQQYQLAAELAAYGLKVHREADGWWYIDEDPIFGSRVVGRKLYDIYHHKGGIIGGSTLKDNEEFAVLKDREWVLSEQMVDNLKTQIERIDALTSAWDKLPYSAVQAMNSTYGNRADKAMTSVVTNNSQPVQIVFGDTIISGANEDTVRRHEEITREQVSQIAKLLKVAW